MGIRPEQVLGYFAEIRKLCDEVLTSAMHSKIKEYRRGGLPTASISEGRRSADFPEPKSDRVDQDLTEAWKTHHTQAKAALEAMREAIQAQRSVLNIKKLEKPNPCKNWRCERYDKEWDAECSRCRQWRSRNGCEYPLQPREEKPA